MEKKPVAVYGAMTANLIIASAKFIAAWVTGSSAMLSEGIHSVVDTGNQLLLLFGLRKAAIPADDEHPFGHGKELYFWSLIVALLLFGIGGGMSFYEGVIHLLHPTPMVDPKWNYIVLLIAFMAEGGSWVIAIRELRGGTNSRGFWQAFSGSKDPSIFTVIAEDSAAMAGLVVAFLGVLLGQVLGSPYLDGIASVLIGVILSTVAVYLAIESKDLLLGESVDAGTRKRIVEIATSHDSVQGVRRSMTMHFGPRQALLVMDLRFSPDLSIQGLTRAIEEIEAEIRKEFPHIRQIFIEAESLKIR